MIRMGKMLMKEELDKIKFIPPTEDQIEEWLKNRWIEKVNDDEVVEIMEIKNLPYCILTEYGVEMVTKK